MKMRTAVLTTTGLLLGLAFVRAADNQLPAALDDQLFWRMVTTFSEPDGTFRYENLLSNEMSYQAVIPSLKTIRSVGAYIGVGPEQNFTYIAALEPKIAFIVDIRRQNTLELLLYKALFEASRDRADFVSRLFSRRRPAGLNETTTVQGLFDAYESLPCDAALRRQTFEDVNDRLTGTHRFTLTKDDLEVIGHVLDAFCAAGPKVDYGFAKTPNLTAPSYAELMTATDGRGQTCSYLATEDNFEKVRNLQTKNLIVPLTGDFAGSRTLRAVGTYLRQRNATATAFYASNVEQYLDKNQTARFRTNVGSLPITSSSVLIRFIPPESTQLERMRLFLSKTGTLFHLLDSDQ